MINKNKILNGMWKLLTDNLHRDIATSIFSEMEVLYDEGVKVGRTYSDLDSQEDIESLQEELETLQIELESLENEVEKLNKILEKNRLI